MHKTTWQSEKLVGKLRIIFVSDNAQNILKNSDPNLLPTLQKTVFDKTQICSTNHKTVWQPEIYVCFIQCLKFLDKLESTNTFAKAHKRSTIKKTVRQSDINDCSRQYTKLVYKHKSTIDLGKAIPYFRDCTNKLQQSAKLLDIVKSTSTSDIARNFLTKLNPQIPSTKHTTVNNQRNWLWTSYQQMKLETANSFDKPHIRSKISKTVWQPYIYLCSIQCTKLVEN